MSFSLRLRCFIWFDFPASGICWPRELSNKFGSRKYVWLRLEKRNGSNGMAVNYKSVNVASSTPHALYGNGEMGNGKNQKHKKKKQRKNWGKPGPITSLSLSPCPDIVTFIYTNMQNSHWDNFMLICIKSIPFWRQFEDWNTNFELSTGDPAGETWQNGQDGSDRNQHWNLCNFFYPAVKKIRSII